MTQENTNNDNKMEVFKTGEIPLEGRRVTRAAGSIIELEKAVDLRAYWKVIRRRRWTVLIAFTVLFGGVLVETLKQKPVYRAKALLEIEKENPSLVTPQELFQIDEVSDAYLETEYKVLSSDDLAERVIAQLGLNQIAEFQPQKRSWPCFPPAPVCLPPTLPFGKRCYRASKNGWTSSHSGAAARSRSVLIRRTP